MGHFPCDLGRWVASSSGMQKMLVLLVALVSRRVLRTAGLVLVASLAGAASADSAAAQLPDPAQFADRGFGIDSRRGGSGSSLLAARIPARQRRDAQRVFDRALVAYREIESNLGLGKNDPAGAIAALVAGCVAAHRDVAISDAALAAVVGQVQRAISAEPRLFHGLRVDRASVAEQMAIIGMMMMTRRGNQDAASVSGSKLAGRYLELYFAARIDDIEITDVGLGWRRGRPGGLLAALVAPSVDTAAISSALAESNKKVEAVGFRVQPRDWDGSGNFDFRPLVLLRSGDAVRNIGAINDRQGLDRHRKTSPEQWTRWRSAGNDIEVLEGGRWNAFAPLVQMRPPLPKGTRLDGTFSPLRHRSSDEPPPFLWSRLELDRSGRFSGSQGSGSKSSTSGRPWITTSSKGRRAAGTYAIDGFTLTLRRDGGQVEHHGIVTHPTNSSFLWVDGVQYTRAP